MSEILEVSSSASEERSFGNTVFKNNTPQSETIGLEFGGELYNYELCAYAA